MWNDMRTIFAFWVFEVAHWLLPQGKAKDILTVALYRAAVADVAASIKASK